MEITFESTHPKQEVDAASTHEGVISNMVNNVSTPKLGLSVVGPLSKGQIKRQKASARKQQQTPSLKQDKASKTKNQAFIRRAQNNTKQRDVKNITFTPLPEVKETRALYSADSFSGEKVYPVKILERDVVPEINHKIIDHPMQPTNDTSSKFIYGHTILSTKTQVEVVESKVSANQAKRNRSKLSKSNFAYDLAGNQIPKAEPLAFQERHNDKMPSKENLDEGSSSSLSSTTSALSIESFTEFNSVSANAVMLDEKSDLNISNEIMSTNDQPIIDEELCLSTIPVNTSNEVPTENESVFFETALIEDDSESDKETDTDKVSFIKSQDVDKQDVKPSKKQARRLEAAEKDKLNSQMKEISNQLAQVLALVASQGEELKALRLENSQLKAQLLAKNTVVNESIPAIIVEVDEKPCTSQQADTRLITHFKDDSNTLFVNPQLAKTKREEKQVIANAIIPKEVRNKAKNQEVRNVSSEKVSQESFKDKLAKGLARSVSNFSYLIPKEKVKAMPPKPKGITMKRWFDIVDNIPDTVEDFQKKREERARKDYKKIFFNLAVKLRGKWIVAYPDHKNLYLSSDKTVLNALKSAEFSKVFDSINVWKTSVLEYIPEGCEIKNWSK